MTEYESENGAMIKCSNCGALIPPDDEFCSNCGTKVNASYKPEDPVSPAPASASPAPAVADPAPASVNKTPASAGKWFSQAGSLDGSEVSGPADSGSVHSGPAVSSDSAPSAGTFIKPVKGIKENSTVIAGRKPEAPRKPESDRIPEVDRKEASPATVVPAKKEVYRCSKCGAVVPKGADLCWKCSSFESLSDKPVVNSVERKAEPSAVSVDRNADYPAVHKEPKKDTYKTMRPRSNTKSNNNIITIIILAAVCVLLLVIGIVILVSKSQRLDLKKLVCTDELLNYQLDDGTVIKSKVKEFEVISNRTKNKQDTSEVKVVLADDFLERTLYITAESSKYKQGWMIDSKRVTQAGFEIVGELDQKYIVSYLSNDRSDTENLIFQQSGLDLIAAGLDNFEITSSTVQDESCFLVCDVNDSHRFADIYGTLYVRVDINMYLDPDTCECTVRRNVQLDTEALITEWHDIYGTYLRTNPDNELEEYVTIDTNSASGYGDYVEFGQQRHNLIDDATFLKYNYSTILIEFYSVNGYSIIKITPDDIAYFESEIDGWYKVDSFKKVG